MAKIGMEKSSILKLSVFFLANMAPNYWIWPGGCEHPTVFVQAHSNAPDCNIQSDCELYLDACCGIAEPTTRGRGESHHICWSKYSTRYLDEEGNYYTFECMSDEKEQGEVVVFEEIDVPMSWYDETLWVDAVIKAMFVCNVFPLIGLPIFLILSLVIQTDYYIMNLWSLVVVIENMSEPLEGKEDWTLNNWFLFPVRRSILFFLLTIFGSIGNLMVPINFIIVPVTGLLAWINNYY